VAFQVHLIARYNYSFDARAGGPGRMQLWAASGAKLAEIGFVDDAAPVPPPQLWPGLAGANAFFRRSSLLGLVDLLRNERPVSFTVNDQPPGFAFVHSGPEPVGEEE
jgi:hypothetical protein